jgi:hypothetical protein
MALSTLEPSPPASGPFSLTLDTFMPDLLRKYPHTRAVLDQHGLRGCGGAEGPHESLGYFVKAHGIDGRKLMDELRLAIAQGAGHMGQPAASAPGPADRIYRPFFLAGIAVVLTLGAVWGAWMLWRIGIAGQFGAAGILEINAHGHAMIFGWVGLFIMGFALQALPRMWHVELPAPRLAVASFVAMVLGIAVRTVAMGLPALSGAAPAALAGGLMELAAIVAVSGILLAAFLRSEVRTEPYMIFILAGLGWFVLQAIAGLWHVWMTMTAVGAEKLLWYVSTYQAPLRDMQIHGLALFMILGVSLRIFPAFFGLPRVSDRRVWTGLVLLTAAVLAEMVFFIAFRWTGRLGFTWGVYSAWLMLAAGVVIITWPWRLWRPLPTHDRSAKFVRIGYGWLAVSLAMLLLLPLYQSLSGRPFSHAYYGAIRHAVTVGFISMMIMGVAAKVVPTLTGRDPRALSALWGPFLLVNIGCLLRVSTQTLTDWNPIFYSIIGLSGTLEVIGLGWWGGHLARMMLTSARVAPLLHTAPPTDGIAGDHLIADVLRWCPGALAVFEQYGFAMLRNPIAQKTFARRVTVAQAASLRCVSLVPLLQSLNDACHPTGAVRYDLPLEEMIPQLPAAAPVLARHGLCPERHGRMTLAQAAEQTGVSKESLVLALAQAGMSDSVTRSGECRSACDSNGSCAQTCIGERKIASVKEARW